MLTPTYLLPFRPVFLSSELGLIIIRGMHANPCAANPLFELPVYYLSSLGFMIGSGGVSAP